MMIFLHGWGLHRGVWDDTLATLNRTDALAIDLPGYGHSAALAEDYTLPALAAAMLRALPPQPATLVGWSLGGMVAMQLALDHPERVARLVLVGSSPQFVADDTWPHAMAAATLEDFAEQLLADHAGTIRRFLALQALGSEHGRDTLTRLKAKLAVAPPPDPRALAGGLRILRDATLVPRLMELAELTMPITVIHGERDTLAPLAAARAVVEHLRRAELRVIDGAGHAPFLSHPERFIEALA